MENTGSSGVVEINTTSAMLFVVIASCFLILLYKLMSFWFLELLVVLFCIGGVEVILFMLILNSSSCFAIIDLCTREFWLLN